MHESSASAVMLPNATNIIPSLQGHLPLSNKLPMKAKKATVLPDLKSSSLISLRQLCDDDCKVLLDKKKLQVFKENDVILEGTRNLKDGLWDMPIKDNYVVPKSHPGLCFKTKLNMTIISDRNLISFNISAPILRKNK